MNISLDYDDTYTRDPSLWDRFVANARERGHKVYCVTMRYDVPGEADSVVNALSSRVDAIYFTGRQGKEEFMFKKGIRIDVWIDDNPNWILVNAAR